MTQKDFVILAKALLTARNRIVADFLDQRASTIDGTVKMVLAQSEADQLRGVRRTAAHLADALYADNKRFDRQRFLTAAGYGA
jgi:hypothetical protein